MQEFDEIVIRFEKGRLVPKVKFVSDWGDIGYRNLTTEEKKLFHRFIDRSSVII